MRPDRLDDRALSSAVSHVLTMAITTILVAGLLTSSGTMLEAYTDGGAEQSLETIGERLAGQLADVDRMADDGDTVSLTTRHPRTVAGSSYDVELLEGGECTAAPLLDDTDAPECLRLTSGGADAEVYVPVHNESVLDTDSEAAGGAIEIVHDGAEIEIRDAN